MLGRWRLKDLGPILLAAFLSLALLQLLGPDPAPEPETAALASFPPVVARSCDRAPGPQRLYDACADQRALFEQAQAAAVANGKVLLVSYGAEWCIWCHVLERYLRGYDGTDAYEVEGTEQAFGRANVDPAAAQALAAFAAETFVLLHLEAQYSAEGAAVFDETGAIIEFDDWIPFVFTVDAAGDYAAHIQRPDQHPALMVWDPSAPADKPKGIGYDRGVLLDDLRRLAAAARP
ncbi:MAG: hypothetical protein AAFV62_00485 [Pseudomonadota bacterium]